MLKIIIIVILVLIAAILIYAASKPDTFRIQRSILIKAPPEKIFAILNDLHRWGVWSPYEKKDPAMKRYYSGAEIGKGAVYEWEGNKNVGKGRMEIAESTVPSRLLIKLDFIAPFQAHNAAEFTLEPQGELTNVTWAMYGPSPFISKVMCLFINMDNMVGKDFEVGLDNLKAISEQ
jgi:carbon monoxide dehydrogenase subunit G